MEMGSGSRRSKLAVDWPVGRIDPSAVLWGAPPAAPSPELLAAAVAACLEALPRAAFILRADGSLVLANARAHGRLRSGTIDLRGGSPGGLIETPIGVVGEETHRLVMVAAESGPDLEAALGEAERRWALSAAQLEVLSFVVRGEANKEVAVRRDCSVRTVEAHVGALLLKAGVTSRGELLAKFWTLPR